MATREYDDGKVKSGDSLPHLPALKGFFPYFRCMGDVAHKCLQQRRRSIIYFLASETDLENRSEIHDVLGFMFWFRLGDQDGNALRAMGFNAQVLSVRLCGCG